MILTPAMLAFLAEPRFGVLATLDAEGAPHQRVVWYEFQGERVLFNTRRGREKERELARDGRASLCMEDGYRFISIGGRIVGAIDDQRIAHDDIRRLAIRYDGADAAERYQSLWTDEVRITYLMSIERVQAYGFSG